MKIHMENSIPTEDDWAGWQADLDQSCAHDCYIGRSNDEMSEHYRIGPIETFDEILFMSKIPFQYYVLGFRDSVLARKHEDFSDSASAAACFLRLVEYRSENNPNDVLEIMAELLPAIEYIAARQEEFDADVDIHGSFPEKLENIRSLLHKGGKTLHEIR